MTELPSMTVESDRVGNAHGIPPPNPDLDTELSKVMVVANHQNTLTDPWPQEVLELLAEYHPVPIDPKVIPGIIKDVLGFDSWYEVSMFSATDVCFDFFNLLLRYVRREKIKPREDKDFIDGPALGWVMAYGERLKEAMELVGDAKYEFKELRPLAHAQTKGLDLAPYALAIHPGHWSYPAWHGCKFLIAVEVMRQKLALGPRHSSRIFHAACIASQGRAGALIHFLQDNVAAGYVTTLHEFQS